MSQINRVMSLVRSLPINPLQPTGHAQLSIALTNILSRSFPSAGIAPPNLQKSIPSAETIPEPAPLHPPSPAEKESLDKMLRAMEGLNANEALMQYPPSVRTLRPAHDPQMYKRVVDGVHRAQNGQGRSWWRRFFQIKGEA